MKAGKRHHSSQSSLSIREGGGEICVPATTKDRALRLRGLPSQVLDCPGGRIDVRHRHHVGYLSIVLEGEEIEAGEEGRTRAGPGDALIHRPFDAHCNYVGARRMKVLCLPLPEGYDGPPMGHLADADTIVRIAERDALAASAVAASAMTPKTARFMDWPDLLADHLRAPASLPLHVWADHAGLAPETISRGFKKLYGVSPRRYRLEYAGRNAWRQIAGTTYSLTDIALACGFADQSHMCRVVRAVTGSAPLQWRTSRSKSFKTLAATTT